MIELNTVEGSEAAIKAWKAEMDKQPVSELTEEELEAKLMNPIPGLNLQPLG